MKCPGPKDSHTIPVEGLRLEKNALNETPIQVAETSCIYTTTYSWCCHDNYSYALLGPGSHKMNVWIRIVVWIAHIGSDMIRSQQLCSVKDRHWSWYKYERCKSEMKLGRWNFWTDVVECFWDGETHCCSTFGDSPTCSLGGERKSTDLMITIICSSFTHLRAANYIAMYGRRRNLYSR